MQADAALAGQAHSRLGPVWAPNSFQKAASSSSSSSLSSAGCMTRLLGTSLGEHSRPAQRSLRGLAPCRPLAIPIWHQPPGRRSFKRLSSRAARARASRQRQRGQGLMSRVRRPPAGTQPERRHRQAAGACALGRELATAEQACERRMQRPGLRPCGRRRPHGEQCLPCSSLQQSSASSVTAVRPGASCVTSCLLLGLGYTAPRVLVQHHQAFACCSMPALHSPSDLQAPLCRPEGSQQRQGLMPQRRQTWSGSSGRHSPEQASLGAHPAAAGVQGTAPTDGQACEQQRRQHGGTGQEQESEDAGNLWRDWLRWVTAGPGGVYHGLHCALVLCVPGF